MSDIDRALRVVLAARKPATADVEAYAAATATRMRLAGADPQLASATARELADAMAEFAGALAGLVPLAERVEQATEKAAELIIGMETK